jgi:hypothetical protein
MKANEIELYYPDGSCGTYHCDAMLRGLTRDGERPVLVVVHQDLARLMGRFFFCERMCNIRYVLSPTSMVGLISDGEEIRSKLLTIDVLVDVMTEHNIC